MRADELMSPNVICVGVDASVHQAAVLLVEHAVSCLPVLDSAGSLVGIVTEIDLLRDRAPRDPRSHLQFEREQPSDPARLVGDVMTRAPVTLPPGSDLADLTALMLIRRIRVVPIVEGGAVLGVVSRRDLVRTLVRTDEAIRDDIQGLLDAEVGEHGRWQTRVADGVVTIEVGGDTHAFGDDQVAALLTATVPGVLRIHVVAEPAAS